MKSQRAFGLSLSWPRVTAVFVAVIVILVVASHCPESWQGSHRIAFWAGVAISLIVALLSLVTHHGVTVTSGLATWLWDWSADPGNALAEGCTPAVDHQRRFGRDTVGVREYNGHLVTVIAVGDGEEDGSARHRHHRAAPASLLVQTVADALTQFDIHLDGIDIISVKVRHGGNAAELSKLDDLGPEEWDLVTDQPTSYVRRTWVVLRLDPQLNVAAVAARDSLASTMVAATERLAHDIDGQHCPARPLTADQFTELDSAVLADLEATWSRPGWRFLKHFNGYVTSFWVTPNDITSETLDDLWAPETGATVLTVRLTTDAGRPQVAAWVRYHSDGRLSRSIAGGLNRLTGRQLAAVRASLPAPTTHSLLVVPSRTLHHGDNLVLSVGHERENAAGVPVAQ